MGGGASSSTSFVNPLSDFYAISNNFKVFPSWLYFLIITFLIIVIIIIIDLQRFTRRLKISWIGIVGVNYWD